MHSKRTFGTSIRTCPRYQIFFEILSQHKELSRLTIREQRFRKFKETEKVLVDCQMMFLLTNSRRLLFRSSKVKNMNATRMLFTYFYTSGVIYIAYEVHPITQGIQKLVSHLRARPTSDGCLFLLMLIHHHVMRFKICFARNSCLTTNMLRIGVLGIYAV